MKAAQDIPHGYAFHVPGINFVNPVTFEDTGTIALFECIGDVKAGEVVERYTPRMYADGPYQNVTRAATIDDLAVQGCPPSMFHGEL